MKCVRITIIMKMGLAAVAIITMNTMTSAGMSTIITAAVVVMNSIIMNMVMEKAVAAENIATMNTKIAAAVDMNIITASTFRVTRRTVSAKSAIRTKNTATFAAKALKTVPAVCRTLTA